VTDRFQPRPDVAMRAGYHSPQVDVDVRLNTNESPFAPPAEFLDEVAAKVAQIDWHRYPDRAATELRERLAEHHGVTPEQVFVANGSNEVLQTVALTYAGPGRTVAVFEPTYAMHSQIAKIAGSDVAVGNRAPDLSLDLAEVRRVVTEADPAITFVCSPNNPTGMVESRDVVEAVLDLAPGLVVVDEAYAQFAPWSALDLLDDDLPMVVTRTFSKTWSMAAARLGYLVGPSWVVDELDKVVLPYHLDALKQAAGVVALDHVEAMNERVSLLVEERGRVIAGLTELPVDVWPSSSNFVLFRPQERSGDDVWQSLLDDSVLVRNCASWPGLDNCLRITIGTRDEDDRFLAALRKALA
jgi:histidinol-phosphate aminotransferase